MLVDVLQTWLIVGVPGLAVAAALFNGRSQARSLAGYLVLVALVATFLLIPTDVISAASIGLIAFFLVATGKGMQADAQPEHHEIRDKYTHTPSAP